MIFRFFLKKNISFLLALLFLLHPIQSEAVDYIADLEDVMFFFFGSLAFLLELKLKPSPKKSISIILLLLFSLLSKETGILFVFIFIVYKYFFPDKYSFKRNLLLYSGIGIAYIFLRLVIFHNILLVTPYTNLSQASFLTRLLTVPLIIFYYLKTFFFPVHLALNQTWLVSTRPLSDFLIATLVDIVVIIILSVFGRIIYKKHKAFFKPYVFFAVWLCLGIFLHSQLVFILDTTVADRFFYFSIVGLLGLLGIVLELFFVKSRNIKSLSISLITLVVVILSLITIVRNTNYYDQYSLLSNDVQYSDNSNIQSAYAMELMKRNQYDAAYKYLQESVTQNPTGYLNWSNLGSYYESTGQYKKAEEAFNMSTSHAPFYLAYETEAEILLVHENPKKAETYIANALRKFPTDGYLWFLYTLVENKLGNKTVALEAAKRTAILFPSNDTYLLYNLLSQNVPVTFKSTFATGKTIIYICSPSGCS